MKWIYVFKNLLIVSIMGFIMSGLINYFLGPPPENVRANVIGNGLSGFMSGFIGILIYLAVGSKKSEFDLSIK